ASSGLSNQACMVFVGHVAGYPVLPDLVTPAAGARKEAEVRGSANRRTSNAAGQHRLELACHAFCRSDGAGSTTEMTKCTERVECMRGELSQSLSFRAGGARRGTSQLQSSASLQGKRRLHRRGPSPSYGGSG